MSNHKTSMLVLVTIVALVMIAGLFVSCDVASVSTAPSNGNTAVPDAPAVLPSSPPVTSPAATYIPGAQAPLASPANSPVAFTMPTVPAGYTYYHDVFVGVGGNYNIYMDICAPSTDPGVKLPVIARIHGGGWNHGDKNDFASTLVGDASVRGYVAVSMMYRLTPSGYKFPEPLFDLKMGIRYLKANAASYFIDPDKIGVWGSSAGGHLASLLGTTGDRAELEGIGAWRDYSSRVHAVVDASGPADFTTAFANSWSSLTSLLGAAALSVPALAHAAMPGDYATADDPPFLILHGDADTTVPYADSVYFKDQLLAASVPTTFSLVAGAGHSLSAYSWVINLQRAFMDYHLKGIGAVAPTPPPYVPLPSPSPSPAGSPDPLLPVAKWQLDENMTFSTLADSSTSDPGVLLKRNGGTLQESGVGKAGNAVHLTNGYTYLSNSPINSDTAVTALNFYGKAGFTVEAWVNFDELPSGYATAAGSAKLIYKINSSTKAGYEMLVNASDNKPVFKIWLNSATKYQVSASTAMTAGTWYHVVGSFDGLALRVYVNGVLDGTTYWSGSIADAGACDIKIGGTTTTTTNNNSGIKGWVDEVRLYDKSLSDSEVLGRFQNP